MTHDQQLPDRGGDILDDIRAALSRRGDLSDEHRAFYSEIVAQFEGLTADRDRWKFRAEARVAARDRMRRQLDHAIEDRDAALTDAATVRQAVSAALAPTDSLPPEDLVEPGDEVPALAELADRVAALETRLDSHTGGTA